MKRTAFSMIVVAANLPIRNPKLLKEDIMSEKSSAQASAQAADKTAIRPFQVNFPEAELTELPSA